MGDLGCDIVGVSDRDDGIAKARAERFGSTPFTDYRRMIETTRGDTKSAGWMGAQPMIPEDGDGWWLSTTEI